MKTRLILIALTLAAAPVLAETAPAMLTSTQAEQSAVEVTVYNSNLGLIKDTRSFEIPEGEGELRFMDVASFIIPEAVHVKALDGADSFAVLEQNYEYDLMSHEKVLDKYVGKTIKIVDWSDARGKGETVEATLLSSEGQIYRIGKEIYLGHPGYKVVPEIPENLISKPTLIWLYSNAKPGARKLEVSYLTTNLSWHADYVLVLDGADKTADLSGWVTIDNQSGAAYRKARLKLVAGEVNRVQDAIGGGDVMMMRATAPMAVKEQFGEQSFFEYHIYDLKRPVTLKNNQTKQISLLEAAGVSVRKEFRVTGDFGYFLQAQPGQPQRRPVDVYVNFKNSKENRLGMPLPEGTMRLYKRDSDSSQQFIGESHIEHTPKDEELRLRIGEAFDVVAERIQTDFQEKPGMLRRSTESAFEITLRNHKSEDIEVRVVEPVNGDWKVLTASHKYRKTDAFTLSFAVPVPKNGEAKLIYRIRVEY